MSRMEDKAPPTRSVAELAGKFTSSAPPYQDARGDTQEKPVRRRPPRSLQLPKQHGDQEPPAVTSPPPAAKTKRNSALIEKLQASLALSPSSPRSPSPSSPGFRLFPPPSFPPPSPGSAPVTSDSGPSSPAPTSPAAPWPITEEEGPASFEAPPTAAEGCVLPSVSKSRARHSVRRRPPSRRHRKSSADDDTGPQGEGPQVEGPQGEGPQGEGPQGEGPQGEGPQGEGKQGEGPCGEGPQGEGPQRPKGEGPQGEGPQGEGPQMAHGDDVSEGTTNNDEGDEDSVL